MTIERTAENDTIMEQMLFNRGMILTCFAQIEWTLGKLLIEAHAHGHYDEQDLSFSVNVDKRIRLLRQLLAAEGPYHEFERQMTPLLEELEGFVELRNFMAHGVLISSPHHKHGITFRLRMFKAFKGGEPAEGWIDFTAKQLTEKTRNISSTAKRTVAVLRQIATKHSLDVFDPDFDGGR